MHDQGVGGVRRGVGGDVGGDVGSDTGPRAQTSVAVAPPEAWVKPVPIPAVTATDSTAAVRFLLQDIQTRFGADGDETYGETAIRFQTPQGLQAGTVALPWNPETDTLTVHKVHIVRGDQVIDVLGAGQTFTVLRRETNLELATLDGMLTAALQPEGLQVGDVLDVAFTLKRHDPALGGRSQTLTGDLLPIPVAHLYLRQVWPASKAMRWKETDGLAVPVVTKTGDGNRTGGRHGQRRACQGAQAGAAALRQRRPAADHRVRRLGGRRGGDDAFVRQSLGAEAGLGAERRDRQDQGGLQ